MSKTDSIARRILGWKLNRMDTWFDYKQGTFIRDFQPERNLEHAMMIVNRLEELGFTYKKNGSCEVCFNDVREKGNTLPEAITNAAYTIVENHSTPDDSRIWQQLC